MRITRISLGAIVLAAVAAVAVAGQQTFPDYTRHELSAGWSSGMSRVQPATGNSSTISRHSL